MFAHALVCIVARCLAASLALFGSGSVAAPLRMASVNLCADQLLLAFAQPAQIRGLGPLARDPELSFFAGRAGALPQPASAEALLPDAPDLLLASRYDKPYLTGVLERRGVRIVRMDHWTTLSETLAGVTAVAHAIGSRDAGDALVGAISHERDQLRALAPRTAGATFLIVHKRGFVEAAGVLRDALEEAGLRMAPVPGATAEGGLVGVEPMLAARPDILVAALPNGRPGDLADALFEHPALTRAFPARARLAVPQALAICPGPSTPALLAHLRQGLEARLADGGLRRR